MDSGFCGFALELPSAYPFSLCFSSSAFCARFILFLFVLNDPSPANDNVEYATTRVRAISTRARVLCPFSVLCLPLIGWLSE